MANLKPGIIQEGVHPLVKELDYRRDEARMSWAELERQGGVGSGVTHPWRTAASAITLQNLEALFGVLGYELRPVRILAPTKQAKYQLNESYRTRCGLFAHITKFDNGVFHGYIKSSGKESASWLKLTWAPDGKRLPHGGEDPYDLKEIT